MKQLNAFNLPQLEASLDSHKLWNAATSWLSTDIETANSTIFRFEPCDRPDDEMLVFELSDSDLDDDADNKWNFEMCVRTFPFQELHGVDLVMPDVNKLPVPLQTSLLSGVYSALKNRLPESFANLRQPSPERSKVKKNKKTDQQKVWFDLHINAGWGSSAVLVLGGKQSDFLEFLGSVWGDVNALPTALADKLTLPVSHLVGTVNITASELFALEQGDLILMDASITETSRQVAIGSKVLAFLATQEGWKLRDIIMEDETGTAPAPSEEPQSETSEKNVLPEADVVPAVDVGKLVALDQIPINISFVIAEQEVAVETLRSWNSQTIVELEAPQLDAGAVISIRANGKPIGVGNLVQIDDRLAVRISSVAKQK